MTSADEGAPRMGERKSAVDRVLDLVVFAPAGFVQAPTEEIDKLAEIGRHRIEGDIHTARIVGQFVVQTAGAQLRKALKSSFSSVGRATMGATRISTPRTGRPDVSWQGAVDEPGPQAPYGAGRDRGSMPDGGDRVGPVRADTGVSRAARAPARGASVTSVSGSPGVRGSVDSVSNGRLGANALAIPGYDSLSASQVVQRLDGLSTEELEEVRRHEQSNRHRRTILNRVDQLLSGSGPDGR